MHELRFCLMAFFSEVVPLWVMFPKKETLKITGTVYFTGQIFFLSPNLSVKALKAYQNTF